MRGCARRRFEARDRHRSAPRRNDGVFERQRFGALSLTAVGNPDRPVVDELGGPLHQIDAGVLTQRFDAPCQPCDDAVFPLGIPAMSTAGSAWTPISSALPASWARFAPVMSAFEGIQP